MRIELQVLTGIALGVVLLMGVVAMRRMSTLPDVAVTALHGGDRPPPGGDSAARHAVLPDPVASRMPEDSGSGKKPSTDELELLAPGSPLELTINTYTGLKSDESMASYLLQRHRQIVESPDEPAWSRDAEQKLRETIALSPDAPSFEIASIMCRAAGCEVQVFVHTETATRAWRGVQEKLAQAIPGSVLASNFNSSNAGRAVSVVFFTRVPAGNDAAPGTPR